MSFDLFVICPKFDSEVAERFNKLERPGFPAGLSIAAEQGAQDKTFWAIHRSGEEWLELNIRRNEGHGTSHQPADIGADWIEIHIPSRGHPMVLHAVAALAEVAGGWVYDPQGAASEVALQAGDDQTANIEYGFYTPTITRELAGVFAAKYHWN